MTMKTRLARGAFASVAVALTVSTAFAADIAVIGGKNDDAFWNLIKKGVDDAALAVEANGGSVNYLRLQSYDNFAPDVVQLIQTAISQNVDGLVIPDWVPEAEDPVIRQAIANGIKVILMNAGGADKAAGLGAINYVGSDEYLAGKAGGEYFAARGQKNVICVNTIPGAANQEARCKGVIDGITAMGGAGAQLPLPSTSFGDPTAVAEAIKATLIKDGGIDGLITVSAGDADSAAIGILQADKTEAVKLGSFDLNLSGLDRIAANTQLFAIDQQPYDISLKVHPGEVLSLLGDNGADKSTLIKALAGVYKPTSGALKFAGKPVTFEDPRAAQDMGIATVHQFGGTFPLMSIGRSFFIGVEPTKGWGPFKIFDRKTANAVAVKAVQDFGITRIDDGDRLVSGLSGGERQSLAIARAVHSGGRALILDEPTAALGVKQASHVLRIVLEAKKRGIAVIFITHQVTHAMAVGDQFAVLIRGAMTANFRRGEKSREEITDLMAGGEALANLDVDVESHMQGHGGYPPPDTA
ncbi:MAG: substrate-binding domain-containing protein [Pseudorhodobacter sp.]|nr:substrate-binding domain-containing protein [Pseudorhodobacter sp.]